MSGKRAVVKATGKLIGLWTCWVQHIDEYGYRDGDAQILTASYRRDKAEKEAIRIIGEKGWRCIGATIRWDAWCGLSTPAGSGKEGEMFGVRRNLSVGDFSSQGVYFRRMLEAMLRDDAPEVYTNPLV